MKAASRSGYPLEGAQPVSAAGCSPVGGACRSRTTLLCTVSLFAAACLAYANSFPGALYMDDGSLLAGNPFLNGHQPWLLLFSDYWGPNRLATGLFRPLTSLTLLVNQWVSPWNALGFHVVNVLLHGVATALVFPFLRALGVRALTAWVAGLFFAVHPIHAEVVNQAVARAESLVVVFLLLSALTSFGEGRKRAVCWIFYLAALLSKENAAVFLALLPVIDLHRFRSSVEKRPRRWKTYAGLIAVTAGWLLYRSLAVPWSPFPQGVDPEANPFAPLNGAARLVPALCVQWVYLFQLLVPLWLQGAYSGSYWGTAATVPWAAGGLLPLAATAGLAWLAWRGWQRGKVYGVCVPLYVVSFAATSNVFFPIGAVLGDRLAYLPSVWFCVGVASLLCDGAPGKEATWRRPLASAAVMGFLVLWVGCLLPWNVLYRSPQALWRETVVREPRNVLAWAFLAEEQERGGRPEEAERTYRALLEANPRSVYGVPLLADALVRRGRPAEALSWARAALDRGAGGDGKTLALLVLAEANAELGRVPEAAGWLGRVDAAYRGTKDYALVSGRVAEARGTVGEALDHYRKVSFLPEGVERLVPLLLRSGRYQEAREVLLAHLNHRETPALWNYLGVASSLLGDREEAVRAFSRAVRLRPEADAYRENFERAVREARRALPQG